MRAGYHQQGSVVGKGRIGEAGMPADRPDGMRGLFTEQQTVAFLEPAAVPAAQTRAQVGGHAAQYRLGMKTALYGQIRAAAVRGAPELEQTAGFNPYRLTHGHRISVQARTQIGAGQREPLSALNSQPAVARQDFQKALVFVVGQQGIGHTRRKAIHGARRTDAEMLVTVAARDPAGSTGRRFRTAIMIDRPAAGIHPG